MTDKQKKRALIRKAERLIRLAYDLEAEAVEMRNFAPNEYRESMKDISSKVGYLGRALRDIAH